MAAIDVNDLDLNDYDFGGSKDWLRAKDLGDDGEEGVVVTISTVSMGKNKKDDGTEEPQPLIFVKEFKNPKGGDKKLGLNITNRKQLLAIFGSKMGAWVGKKIKIYTVETTDGNGNPTLGIRIRSKLPPQDGGGSRAPSSGGNPFGSAAQTFGPQWADAMTAAAKKVNLTIDNIRKWLEDNDAAPLQTIASDPPNWPREWMPTIKKLIEQPSLAASSNSGAVRASSASDEQPDLGGEPEAPF